MEKPIEDNLYQAIVKEDENAIIHFLSLGANPNKTASHGKTCLGEAANIGNVNILKLLIEAMKKTNISSNVPYQPIVTSKKRHIKSHKRKHKLELHHDDTIVKYKNVSDRLKKNQNENVAESGQNINQGYYVFIHNDGSSSDESKICNVRSPVSPSTLSPSPQADLEWDEEIGNVAPTTSEDERWSSIYKWYAAILESTGAAIASGCSMSYGIDQQDAFTRTALHYAVHQGHAAAVKLLLDAGCKVDVTAGGGLTPLHMAVVENQTNIVEMLLNAGSHVNYKTHEKMTPLHFASSRGYLDIVKSLVGQGAYLEARDTSERTPLYLAAGRGHVEVVQYFISCGANVNGEEIHGYTPLCEAVWQRCASVVKILLSSGARVTHSHKLLHNAIIQRQEEIVHMLVNHGGAINLHNDNGDTPLLLAARLSLPSVARVLLKNGANVNACNSITGANVLHIAVESIDCREEFEELLICLIEYKIDMDTVALTGDTALNRALLLHRDHAATLLIRYGADVNACDLHSCGLDNLSIASRRRSSNLASMLLNAGHYTTIPEPNSSIPKPGTTANWLYYVCKQPLSLSNLCRIRIRKMSSNRILFHYVSTLPLPKRLKSFIMMEDEGV